MVKQNYELLIMNYKTMKNIYFYIIVLVSFLAGSCSEKELTPISASTGKPESVTVLGVNPVPGGAIITFRIPENEDILAVKAVYTLSNGRKMEATTSFYDNELQILGYNDLQTHEVTLYSVNRTQEYSDPQSISITPLESPLSKTAKSIVVTPDFGGANFSWRNEDRQSLAFEFLAETANGDMQTVRVITSAMDSLSYTIRGYDPKPTKFGVIVNDNYGNETEIISAEQTIVPLYEQKFDKSIQKVKILSGDMSFSNWEGRNEAMIDDDPGTFGHSPNGPNGNIGGASFTLDLGKMSKISRFLYYQRGDGGRNYRAGNARFFEVYTYTGDSADDNPSGDWNQWEKVIDCEVIKPSNSPGTTVTDEDELTAISGHEFTIPLSCPPMRYLRFRVVSVWSNWNDGSNYWHPAEFTTFGVYDE
jgi:hypothetical protein